MIGYHIDTVGNNLAHLPDIINLSHGLCLDHDITDSSALLRTGKYLNAERISRKLRKILVQRAATNDM